MARHPEDLENGDVDGERSLSHDGGYDNLDEYAALQKYITTYRDPKAAALEEEDHLKNAIDARKSGHWWAFWRRGTSSEAAGSDTGVVPDDWLNADIKQGISAAQVDQRRKRFGPNELASEKENMFLKFLSYFTGPILYGELSSRLELV